ncbi:MAG TPA: tRNA uridine-5-carboxymethylaminomethyl(34) synthesis GTPase MnmE [Steroidobacteraceae bacterium]|nr:tRNA uridine-5-carboxymethylaminomethyl(34) synthesis GTPase MnmE [Steroidobacteraceae bacterium]
MTATDTIVAIATPPGRGGVGIVRVSGPAAAAIGRALAGPLPPPRRAVARHFRDAAGEALDAGLALWFPAPHSFTGEDVLELHGHGGPVVLDLVVARCLALGARAARAGEFSERAFLNDRLDLAQAEAIAALIDAGSGAAARAALRSLDGEFSARVHALEAGVAELRVHVEASIDFGEEDLELLADGGVAERLAALARELEALAASAEQGRLLQEGCAVVIAGRPNAGKSSLLNALAGHDAAIVTEVPGTTRDVLRERISLEGLPLLLLDTAGLRDSPERVEAEGIRRARAELARADHVLYVVDATDPAALAALPRELAALAAGPPVTVVWNKADLAAPPAGTGLAISALTGQGLAALRAHLRTALGYRPGEAGVIAARRRHLDALARTQGALGAAAERLAAAAGTELVAEELRLAHDALGEITGRVTSDDLLGRIFASFCIGK